MAPTSLPAAFAFLQDDPNPAVDRALIEALPDVDAFVQAAALELLIRRGHTPALADLVIRFPSYAGTWSEIMAARAGELAPGIRAALNEPQTAHRLAAIELIERGDAAELAYLLCDALKTDDRQVRERAAQALLHMTCPAASPDVEDPSPTALQRRETRLAHLAEAVGGAIRLWNLHRQASVLQAAIALEDRVLDEMTVTLKEPQSTLARALSETLESSGESWPAAFALRSLAIPEMRAAAAQAITKNENPSSWHVLVRSSWLLADPVIEKSCRRLQPGPWIDRAVFALTEMDAETVAQGVRWLAAMGGTPEQRMEALTRLLNGPHEAARRAALWAVIADESDAATELLRCVASRGTAGGSTIAARELRRRRRNAGGESRATPSVAPTSHAAAVHAAFEQYWTDDPNLSSRERDESEETLRLHRAEAQVCLRRKMASAEPLDRARALRLISQLGWTSELAEVVERAARDPHPLVRSAAVARLAELPGPTSERLLRDAARDPDERVQADAVEALDRLNVPSRAGVTEALLSSPHPRVRANAIKSLLRMELRTAAEALLKMLEEDQPAHRLSALWVVEHFGSQALWKRIMSLSRSDADARVRHRAHRVIRFINETTREAPVGSPSRSPSSFG